VLQGTYSYFTHKQVSCQVEYATLMSWCKATVRQILHTSRNTCALAKQVGLVRSDMEKQVGLVRSDMAQNSPKHLS